MKKTEQASVSKTAFWLPPLLMVLALIAGVGFFLYLDKSRNPQGPLQTEGAYRYEPARALSFEGLSDHDGQPVDLSRYKGDWVMVVFGYLSCPDVCPLTLGIMKSALKSYTPPDGDPLPVLYITVDPERDSPEKLKEYLAYFGDEFVGVTGSLEDITHAGRQLNTVFIKQEPPEGETFYTVSHSSSLALVNPEGEFSAMLKGPESVAQMQSFLQEMLGGKVNSS